MENQLAAGFGGCHGVDLVPAVVGPPGADGHVYAQVEEHTRDVCYLAGMFQMILIGPVR